LCPDNSIPACCPGHGIRLIGSAGQIKETRHRWPPDGARRKPGQ
jgi:hypothetical protein